MCPSCFFCLWENKDLHLPAKSRANSRHLCFCTDVRTCDLSCQGLVIPTSRGRNSCTFCWPQTAFYCLLCLLQGWVSTTFSFSKWPQQLQAVESSQSSSSFRLWGKDFVGERKMGCFPEPVLIIIYLSETFTLLKIFPLLTIPSVYECVSLFSFVFFLKSRLCHRTAEVVLSPHLPCWVSSLGNSLCIWMHHVSPVLD